MMEHLTQKWLRMFPFRRGDLQEYVDVAIDRTPADASATRSGLLKILSFFNKVCRLESVQATDGKIRANHEERVAWARVTNYIMKNGADVVDVLSRSRIYHNYEDAFGKTTKLPLGLASIGHEWEVHLPRIKYRNSFCAIIARTNLR